MNFKDIPQLPRAHYEIDVSWLYVREQLAHYEKDTGLNLNPVYQRAHVWSKNQQRAYIEYCLMGGEVARVLTFNSVNWQHGATMPGVVELIDGKQRLQAVLDFLDDKIFIFGGNRCSKITGRMRDFNAGFKFRICTLKTRVEILQLYLNINAGGTPHTNRELNKVRKMLAEELALGKVKR